MKEWKRLCELPEFDIIVEGKASDCMGDFTFKCQHIKYKKPVGKMTWRWLYDNQM